MTREQEKAAQGFDDIAFAAAQAADAMRRAECMEMGMVAAIPLIIEMNKAIVALIAQARGGR